MTYDRSTTSGQVPTWGVSIETVMSTPEFKRGLDDVRNGVAFDWRIDEWEYERGRLFGFIAPPDMPLRIADKLNPKAIALYKAARTRRLII